MPKLKYASFENMFLPTKFVSGLDTILGISPVYVIKIEHGLVSKKRFLLMPNTLIINISLSTYMCKNRYYNNRINE